MFEERLPIVAIKRSLGSSGCLSRLHVFVDGQWVGSVRENRIGEFLVTPGEHLITVTHLNNLCSAQMVIMLREGDRADLVCTSNAVPLHPWHVHWFWYILFWAPLFSLGFFVAPIRAFWDVLGIEMLVMTVFAYIGMIIYFWRGYKTGAWRPVLYLTSPSYPDLLEELLQEEQTEEEEP